MPESLVPDKGQGRPEAGTRAAAPRRLRTFTALGYPNYRLWFYGQMVSLFGTWMQSTAQGYFVFELTHSAAYLGYVGFAGGIATWLFMLYGGVIADRVPRRSLLVVAQTALMVLAFVLGLLSFLGVVRPWHIIVLAFLTGTANAFDAPARQAFTLEMVERKDLSNAIALNSTMFNTATAVGPAAGGMVYAFFGPSWCFTVNGISFLAVIAALLAMRLRPFTPPVRGGSAFAEMREGMGAVRRSPMILTLMCMVAVISLFGLSYVTLLPAWAVKVLGGDARTNGFLQSARGIGSLAVALIIASLGRVRYKGRLLTVGALLLPVALALFSLVRNVAVSLGLLVAIGGCSILFFNLANSLVQELVPDRLRGRVMGIYSLAFMGSMPIGSLLAGSLANVAGEPITVLLSAGITFCCIVTVNLAVPSLRRQE